LISELSGIYVGSRKTIYKWLERHEEEGIVGLKDRSRRPHESPHRGQRGSGTGHCRGSATLEVGPRKLRVKLGERDGSRQWPSVSTVASVLKNRGLVVNRRRRAHTPIQTLFRRRRINSNSSTQSCQALRRRYEQANCRGPRTEVITNAIHTETTVYALAI
jgi:hypothetical protein